MTAADLPDNSIVVGHRSGLEVVCIKNHPSGSSQWRCTNGGHAGNWWVQELLDRGDGVVLRVGGQ